MTTMTCRKGCGACCIAISISSNIPNHPEGKPAGVRCKNLNEDNSCSLWGTEQYPKVCNGFQAEPMFCGDSFEQAMKIITEIENSFKNDQK